MDAVQQTNTKLAERLQWPLWRHAAVGAVMVVALLGIGLRENGIFLSLGGMFFALLLIRDDKNRYGMWVSGYQKGRTRWVTGAIIALAVLSIFAVWMQVTEPFADPLFWVIATIAFLGSTALSILWQQVYRAEIRGGRS